MTRSLKEIITTSAGVVILWSKDKSKVLGRFEFGKGKKHKDAKDARAAAHKREGQVQFFKKTKESNMPDGLTLMGEALSLGEKQRIVSAAFRQQFNPERSEGPVDYESRPYLQEVYEDFALVAMSALKYRVNFTMDTKGDVTFTPRDKWTRAQMEVVTVESETPLSSFVFGEHLPAMMQFPKNTADLSEGMEADIVLIRPGFGNQRDNHYYSPEVLRRDAGVFEGTKMYATNHKDGEHNVRNWVATVTESGKRFMGDGSPIARVAVHKRDFWEDIRGLEQHGLLHMMHNSILATGKATQGEIDGKPANIVERIVAAKAVDFVNKAGAGGHVLSLVEQFEEEGDLDVVTYEILVERRPDLVEQAKQEAKSSYAADETPDIEPGEIHVIQEEIDMASEKDSTLSAAELEELRKIKVNYEALEERNAELKATLAENEEEAQRQTAVQYLLESSKVKQLPQVAVDRIKTTIEQGIFVEDADVEKEVDALLDEELEYVKSLGVSVAATGMGESGNTDEALTEVDADEEDDAQPTDEELAEQEKAIDALLNDALGRTPIHQVQEVS